MLLGSILCSLAPLITVSVVSECHTTNNAFIVPSQTTGECLSLWLIDRYNGSDVWFFSCKVLYCRSCREDPLVGIQIYFFSI